MGQGEHTRADGWRPPEIWSSSSTAPSVDVRVKGFADYRLDRSPLSLAFSMLCCFYVEVGVWFLLLVLLADMYLPRNG